MIRSKEQEVALETVRKKDCDALIVLPTGEGKSVTVEGPVLEELGVTIWLVPLSSLAEDVKLRLRQRGLKLWTIENVLDIMSSRGKGNIILLRPEECMKENTGKIIETLAENGCLNRFVVEGSSAPNVCLVQILYAGYIWHYRCWL